MEIGNYKIKHLFLRKNTVIAAIILIVAILFIGNSILAKELKLKNQEIEKIQTILSSTKTISDFGSVLLEGDGFLKA